MSPFRSQLGNIKAMNCIIPTSCWMEAIAFFTDLPHSGNTCDFCQSPVFFSDMVFRYFIFVRAGWEPIFGWLRAKCCLIENGLFGGKTFSHLVYLCFIHLDFWLNQFFLDHNPFFSDHTNLWICHAPRAYIFLNESYKWYLGAPISYSWHSPSAAPGLLP